MRTLFNTLLLLFALYICECDKFKDLELGKAYENLITEGNLTAKLYRVVLNVDHPPPAIRVSVASNKATIKNPLTLTIVRGKTIHNIALSRVQSQQGQRFEYWFASDTLCDYDRSNEQVETIIASTCENLFQLGQPVQLSIASSLPGVFNLTVKPVNNFHIGYTFPEDVEKVDVRITSTSETCGRLITRKAFCPLFDASGLPELSEVFFFQTFTKFGGFTLRKSDIGQQFHVAFTVNPDDSLCGFPANYSGNDGGPARIKAATISVTPVTAYLKYRMLDRHENNEPNIFEGTDSEGNVIIDKLWLFDKPTMIVSHKEYEKQRLVKESKYFKSVKIVSFLFFQIFGSILPALTTLFQNRQKSSNRMNLDICFLNYLCSSDMFYSNSFNSMTSSSSMAIIGILNLIVVFRKQIFHYQVPQFPTTHGIQQRDAPKIVCLLGLIAMGILWTITSNCPNKTTLHLYSYTSLWLCYSATMWIYSKRHGVKKWQQYFIIAVSSEFGCLTLAEYMFEMSGITKIIVKIVFFLSSVVSSGYLCFKYYYEKPSGLQEHHWITLPFKKPAKILCDEKGCYQPLKSKIAFVVVSIGYTIACTAMACILDNDSVYIMSFTLGKGQVAIYLIFYIIQKIRFERNSFSLSYKIIGFLLSFSFFSFEFVSRSISWFLSTSDYLLTPAKSRELNMKCVFPGIDWNDLRHYNCAFDCFLFILLMDFIDSNLKGVPKKHIFVF
ncbi:hypothetical protein CRE_16687 [Caenorhabditis remanei]|uniref:Uncharacterized protein n=1 Tax=Caenorhabditis remanei TaxID=31234 RepID=E3MB35_CAERE|nr:hypothetical protein CRE_16687 [Caenorhabditis remanei]